MAKSRMAASGAAGARTGRERRAGWWQRALTWVLLVLACLAVPAAALAGWARWDLLDADRYVRTVQPLGTDPAVQDAAIAVADAAFSAGVAAGSANGAGSDDAIAIAPVASPARVAAATPIVAATPGAADRATPGAVAVFDEPTSDVAPGDPRPTALPEPPVLGNRTTGGAARAAERRAVSAAIAATVRSPAFAEEWGVANRAAHDALTDPAAVGQPVVLDLAPLATRVAETLGPGAEAALPDPAAMRVVLLDAGTADRVRGTLDRVGWLGIVLPVAAVLLIAGTLWFAPNRIAALRRLGFGVVLTTTVTLLALLVAATGFGGWFAGPGGPIASAVADVVLRTPLLWLAIAALAGLVVALLGVAAGWLTRDRPVA